MARLEGQGGQARIPICWEDSAYRRLGSGYLGEHAGRGRGESCRFEGEGGSMIIQELFPEVQDRIEFAAGHEHLEDAVEFALHAPKGGITIEGKSFRGGQFIPGAVAAQASPEQQKQLAEGQAARKVKH